MKQCRNCGTVNNDSASFCRICGSALEQNINENYSNTQGGSMDYQQPSNKNNSTALVVIIGILSAIIVVIIAVLIVIGVSSVKKDGNVGYDNGGNKVIQNGGKKANDEPGDELLIEQKQNQQSQPKASTYKVYKSNASWTEAHGAAASQGGFLACVNSYDEFQKLCSLADASNIKVFWIGAKRNGDSWSNVNWISGEPMSYTYWHPNEPSYYSAGEEERYLMAFKVNGVWYFNDAPNVVSNLYAGKMGYIVEFR